MMNHTSPATPPLSLAKLVLIALALSLSGCISSTVPAPTLDPTTVKKLLLIISQGNGPYHVAYGPQGPIQMLRQDGYVQYAIDASARTNSGNRADDNTNYADSVKTRNFNGNILEAKYAESVDSTIASGLRANLEKAGFSVALAGKELGLEEIVAKGTIVYSSIGARWKTKLTVPPKTKYDAILVLHTGKGAVKPGPNYSYGIQLSALIDSLDVNTFESKGQFFSWIIRSPFRYSTTLSRNDCASDLTYSSPELLMSNTAPIHDALLRCSKEVMSQLSREILGKP